MNVTFCKTFFQMDHNKSLKPSSNRFCRGQLNKNFLGILHLEFYFTLILTWELWDDRKHRESRMGRMQYNKHPQPGLNRNMVCISLTTRPTGRRWYPDLKFGINKLSNIKSVLYRQILSVVIRNCIGGENVTVLHSWRWHFSPVLAGWLLLVDVLYVQWFPTFSFIHSTPAALSHELMLSKTVNYVNVYIVTIFVFLPDTELSLFRSVW